MNETEQALTEAVAKAMYEMAPRVGEDFYYEDEEPMDPVSFEIFVNADADNLPVSDGYYTQFTRETLMRMATAAVAAVRQHDAGVTGAGQEGGAGE